MFIHLTLLQMSVLRLEEINVITRHPCNKDQCNTILKINTISSYPISRFAYYGSYPSSLSTLDESWVQFARSPPILLPGKAGGVRAGLHFPDRRTLDALPAGGHLHHSLALPETLRGRLGGNVCAALGFAVAPLGPLAHLAVSRARNFTPKIITNLFHSKNDLKIKSFFKCI